MTLQPCLAAKAICLGRSGRIDWHTIKQIQQYDEVDDQQLLSLNKKLKIFINTNNDGRKHFSATDD